MGDLKLRAAIDGDAENLLRWRNQPHVRASMVNQQEIALDAHLAWWAKAQTDPSKRFLILEKAGAPVAVVNFFDIEPGESAWWGFYLTDHEAAEGADALAIWMDAEAAALRYAFEALGLKRLLCETRSTNEPVLALHDRFGFETLPQDTSPTAAANDLIVKAISAEAFAAEATPQISAAAASLIIELDPRDAAAAEPAERLIFIGSANWDDLALGFTDVWRAATGQRVEAAAPPFGQGFLHLLDPGSDTRRQGAGTHVFTERFEDFLPPFAAPTPEALKTAEARFEDYLQTLRSVREAVSGRFLIHDVAPIRPALTSFDDLVRGDDPASRLAASMNERLRAFAEEAPDCHLLPLSAVVARIGRAAADPGKYWLMGRFPFGPKFAAPYFDMLLGALMAATQKTVRAIVLDLDNTLWGGVVGDDGVDNLALGSDYPDNQFVAFQAFIADCASRGLVLAVCSKNTEEVAMDAIRRHPAMVLKEEDFVARRINWAPKSRNIAEIAAELDLGPGSLMFIDDNPMERGEVRQNLPGVVTPEMPEDVAEWPGFLATHPALATLRVLDEDRDKAAKYRTRQQINQLRAGVVDHAEFLRNLGMGIEIADLTPASRARALQLIAKTNQFNTTTTRYSEADVDAMIAAGDSVATVRITDRFGSDEIIAVVAAKYEGDRARVDNFVMSCRVLGRGVEQAVLAELSDRAAARGCATLEGLVIETDRNQPCRDVFARHGFEDGGDGVFRLDLAAGGVERPDWFEYLAEGGVIAAKAQA